MTSPTQSVAASQLTNANFFLAIATILPVLFIALLLQSRETPASWDHLRALLGRIAPVLPVLTLVVALWIGLAEFAALDVLRRNRTTTIDSVLVDGGISLAALGLLAPITVSLVEEFPRALKSRLIVRVIYLVVGLIWLIAILYFTPRSPLR
jgi:hypothetical protein